MRTKGNDHPEVRIEARPAGTAGAGDRPAGPAGHAEAATRPSLANVLTAFLRSAGKYVLEDDCESYCA